MAFMASWKEKSLGDDVVVLSQWELRSANTNWSLRCVVIVCEGRSRLVAPNRRYCLGSYQTLHAF